jgi:hypothetical protein
MIKNIKLEDEKIKKYIEELEFSKPVVIKN